MKKYSIRFLFIISIVLTIFVLSTSIAFAAVNPKDSKYHDPNVWTDPSIYTDTEIVTNNKAMWNITQYKIDYNVDKGVTLTMPATDTSVAIPVMNTNKPSTLRTVTVTSPAAITVSLKNNKVTTIEANNSSFTRNEFIFELKNYASSDLVLTAFGIKELNISKNEKAKIFKVMSPEVKLDIFPALNVNDQMLLLSARDSDNDWWSFPVSDAMEIYQKDAMLDLYNAAKAIDALSMLDGSSFNQYRMCVYLSKYQPDDIDIYMRDALYLTYGDEWANNIAENAELVLEIGNDINALSDDSNQIQWNDFIINDEYDEYGYSYYDANAAIQNAYDHIYSFYIEMNYRMPRI